MAPMGPSERSKERFVCGAHAHWEHLLWRQRLCLGFANSTLMARAAGRMYLYQWQEAWWVGGLPGQFLFFTR
jgi:hypothetical protein